MANADVREVTSLWNDYQNAIAYQGATGLSKKLPRFVKFYEGDQWPAATENTKNMPRPVVNIIKMICRNKKSAILSVPVKIVYHAEDEGVDVEKFNRFADYIMKELGGDVLDKKAIDDAVKKGSYFYHYYWDSEARGKDGREEGGLRCEIIDPLSIYFSDPTELDEQKQEWIMLASRENVKSVRAKCDPDIDPDLIVSDKNESKYGTVEQEGDELCTVLTRYFRRGGEVFCEKATKNLIVNRAFSITPDIDGAKRALGFSDEEDSGTDAPNNSLPDKGGDKSLVPLGVKANLYPIVAGSYEIRENSIYGLSEVEGIIPNQKAINFMLAMALLNAQETAWSKYIVVKGALQGQVITNEPGQVLVDHTGTGTGIRKLAEAGMSGVPINLVETITNLTRVMTGATEVMTGETLGAGMSGAAIAQLQSQAQGPIEELRDAFWLVKEKQGKVLMQFFKLYYAEREFSYEEENVPTDENGAPIDGASPESIKMHDIFNSDEYKEVNFSVVVEATAGTKASAAGDINALDVLLSKGLISPLTYFKSYPDDALTNKTKIIKSLEEEEQGKIKELTAALELAERQNVELAKLVEEQRGTVDKVVSVIQENNQLKSFIANLYTESSAKIREANSQISFGNARLKETESDASEMAQFIAAGGGNITPSAEGQSKVR